MSWTLADIAVVAVLVLQVGAWIVLAVAVLKIKSGPVAASLARVGQFRTQVQTIVEMVTTTKDGLAARVKNLKAHTGAIRGRLVRPATPAGMWLHPGNLQRGLLLLSQVKGFKNRRTQRTATKSRNKTLHLAERLGLLPPILKRLGPLAWVGKTALQVAKHWRR